MIDNAPRWFKCPKCSNAFFTSCPEGQWCANDHRATLCMTPVVARHVTTHDGWQGTYDDTIEVL